MERVEESRLKNETQEPIVLLAPLTGPVVPLADVPDPVFAGGMLGDGIGIDPLEGRLVAPCEGVVTHLARTGHALTLQTPQGAEILLHIGIDTVDLNGQGFTAKIAQGARVKPGDLLIEFDQDFVATKAPSLVSVIAVANTELFEIVERPGENHHKMIRTGDPLLVLRSKTAIADRAPAPTRAATPDTAAAPQASREITLAVAGGLHARPAARAREQVREA